MDMHDFVIEFSGWLALVAALVALLLAAVGVKMMRRMYRTERQLLAAVSSLERDLRFIGISLNDAGHRVHEVEGRVSNLKRAQASLESRATGSSNYAQAVSLVRRGWRMDDLMSTCGLTRGEAELVYLLHGPNGAMKQTADVGLS